MLCGRRRDTFIRSTGLWFMLIPQPVPQCPNPRLTLGRRVHATAALARHVGPGSSARSRYGSSGSCQPTSSKSAMTPKTTPRRRESWAFGRHLVFSIRHADPAAQNSASRTHTLHQPRSMEVGAAVQGLAPPSAVATCRWECRSGQALVLSLLK